MKSDTIIEVLEWLTKKEEAGWLSNMEWHMRHVSRWVVTTFAVIVMASMTFSGFLVWNTMHMRSLHERVKVAELRADNAEARYDRLKDRVFLAATSRLQQQRMPPVRVLEVLEIAE